MKPDKLDKKIQEAARHEPPFSEEAWSAMEKVLDEKMPVVKRGKRIIFWWFLFICMIAGSVLWLLLTEKKSNPVHTAIISKEDQSGRPSIPYRDSNSIPTAIPKNNTPRTSRASTFQTNIQKNTITESVAKKQFDKTVLSNTNNYENIYSSIPVKKENEPAQKENKGTLLTGVPQENLISFPTDLFGIKKQLEAAPKNNFSTNIEQGISNDDPDGKEQDNARQQSSIQKKNRKFRDAFSINFSLGPDISAVDLDNTGKPQGVYGAGISYRISNRLTARTGFYISRKVYEAPSSAYNPPSNFWNYYPYLKHVDANCKIFEVPVVVNYNFSNTIDHHWFASLGVASYFMKTEAYEYYSKLPTGQSTYNNYSIKNKNQHYFSSIRIGAGYEKKISNIISLSAEPYLYLPVSGIGYGKVKLYNSGILFTLSVQPFSKK